LAVLKLGTDCLPTATWAPVRGSRPVWAGRCFTEKTPKPRSSTRSPALQRGRDLTENDVDDVLHVMMQEVPFLLGDALHELGLKHRCCL
jgi:hypothetical protein